MLAKLIKKRINIYFSGLLIANDFLVILIAFFFSYWFRFHSSFFSNPLGIPSYQDYALPVFFITILLIATINYSNLYKPLPTKKFIEQGFSLLKSICITMLLILAGTFFYRGTTYSRSMIFILWVSLGLLLILSRYLLNIFYIKKVLPKVKKKIIIIGKPESVAALKKRSNYFEHYGEIIGVISMRKHEQPYSQIEHLGYIDDYEAILDKAKPDEVVLADLELPRKRIINLMLGSEKRLVSFKIIADLLEIMIQQFELENINGLNLIKIKESPLNYAFNRFLKRFMDMLGSMLGLILLSPVFMIISILIKLDSKGPTFFSQERVGEDGRIFKIYKFRTMYQDAEGATGPVFAKKDDERCTRLGGFLRAYNLDELPQLFNVLKGEMSLVGPRPERPYFVEQFKDDIPRYMSRHHIKSGITGWAQINGFRQGTPIDERIKYDLYYLENWSMWFDLKIIFLSFFALKNAY